MCNNWHTVSEESNMHCTQQELNSLNDDELSPHDVNDSYRQLYEINEINKNEIQDLNIDNMNSQLPEYYQTSEQYLNRTVMLDQYHKNYVKHHPKFANTMQSLLQKLAEVSEDQFITPAKAFQNVISHVLTKMKLITRNISSNHQFLLKLSFENTGNAFISKKDHSIINKKRKDQSLGLIQQLKIPSKRKKQKNTFESSSKDSSVWSTSSKNNPLFENQFDDLIKFDDFNQSQSQSHTNWNNLLIFDDDSFLEDFDLFDF